MVLESSRQWRHGGPTLRMVNPRPMIVKGKLRNPGVLVELQGRYRRNFLGLAF